MAHILPHWNWPERVGQVTPVHVYTSGDEAELFLNGKSLGRKKSGPLEYRLRWDDVVYAPGALKVVAYKAAQPWAEDACEDGGPRGEARADAPTAPRCAPTAATCRSSPWRSPTRRACSFPAPRNALRFTLTGPGEIVAMDNGDATSFEPFQASCPQGLQRPRPGHRAHPLWRAGPAGVGGPHRRPSRGAGDVV